MPTNECIILCCHGCPPALLPHSFGLSLPTEYEGCPRAKQRPWTRPHHALTHFGHLKCGSCAVQAHAVGPAAWGRPASPRHPSPYKIRQQAQSCLVIPWRCFDRRCAGIMQADAYATLPGCFITTTLSARWSSGRSIDWAHLEQNHCTSKVHQVIPKAAARVHVVSLSPSWLATPRSQQRLAKCMPAEADGG